MLIRALSFIVGLLSWTGVQRVGAAIGLFWYAALRIRRNVVLENLALALPGSTSRHHDIARRAFEHFGMSIMEFLKMGQAGDEELQRKVRVRGMDHFDAACARGRGVVVITAHFGNFDMLACSQASRGVPLAIVSRRLHAGGIDRFWMQTRRARGLEIFPDKGAGKSLLRWLKEGKVLGLTVDQRTPAEKGGILEEFMGWRVWTTTAPAALAIAAGAAVVPIRLERRPDGDHDLIVEPEIPLPDGNRESAIQELTRQINGVVGKWILQRPDQWMWLHRRFVGAREETGA